MSPCDGNRFPFSVICPECAQDAQSTEERTGQYVCAGCGTLFDFDQVNRDGTYKPHDWEETEE